MARVTVTEVDHGQRDANGGPPPRACCLCGDAGYLVTMRHTVPVPGTDGPGGPRYVTVGREYLMCRPCWLAWLDVRRDPEGGEGVGEGEGGDGTDGEGVEQEGSAT